MNIHAIVKHRDIAFESMLIKIANIIILCLLSQICFVFDNCNLQHTRNLPIGFAFFFSVIILPSATNNVKKIFKSTYAVFQSKQEERPLKQTLLFVFLVLLVSVQITCRCCSGAG